MTTRVALFRWEEPETGSDAEVWNLDDAGWVEVEKALSWVKTKAGAEYGNSIIEVTFNQTKATDGDITDTKEALKQLALQTRYNSGEELYEEDCPVFAKYGIQRS